MPSNNSQQSYSPGPAPGTVKDNAGSVLHVPPDWILLPPGDAGLTRRVKAAGQYWQVEEKKGRKIFSRGIYAPKLTIEKFQQQLEAERATDSYKRKLASSQQRREAKQVAYVDTFEKAVLEFLDFHESYHSLAQQMANAVAAHATPVGSGTVARTQRIPVQQRAAAAVIAWMRHQTTAYDSMTIPRVKGARREVRRMLAERSQQVLACYRQGKPVSENCPLSMALKNLE